MKKIIISLLLTIFSTMSFAAKSKDIVKVKLETNYGEIVLDLYEKKAPITVKNFLSYVDKGFFEGTIFHRVIGNFMVQGGGFLPTMEKKNGVLKPIKNEADNGLSNDIGTIAMARTNAPHSATAQFFINVQNNTFLNHRSKEQSSYGYAVFGKVAKGMSVVNRIKKVKTQNFRNKSGMTFQNVPVEPVVIKKAKRL